MSPLYSRHAPRVRPVHVPEGWQVQFLETDLGMPLRKRLNLRHESKIIELAERGGADLSLEARAALGHGIQIGRGGFYLNLTDEQYRRLGD